MNDLRYSLRSLMRMRGVAALAILTLALGIGATTTMFSAAYAALLRPLPFADPERLVLIFTTRTSPREGFVRSRWSRPLLAPDRIGGLLRSDSRPSHPRASA
jgi:hypothetical protein